MCRLPSAVRIVVASAPTMAVLAVALLAPAADPPKPQYVKKADRVETVLASLKASGLPTLEGKWHFIGPFDNDEGQGFDAVYPPEKDGDLTKTYPGKGGEKVGWKEYPKFRPGQVNNLALFKQNSNAVVYLQHEIAVDRPVTLPLSLGSDDGLVVWLNGEKLVEENAIRPAAPDQNHAVLKLKPGKNRLLLKVTQGGGEWSVYVLPEFPQTWPGSIRQKLDRDFAPGGQPGASGPSSLSAEAAHYRMTTVPVPPDVVLEVGGLGFRPDGKLLACTRRGEVWLIEHPEAEGPAGVKFARYASGLHEALGLIVEDDRSLLVTQRPEITRLSDKEGTGRATDFATVCDKWGVSGDYHEFAFGPARDKAGNLYVTLNVGFGGGHQSKAPWRGWCVQITPKGELVPFAVGLRSPNGITTSPDGDLFYTDNQGEWVATNKLHQIRKGEFYGHPAGLRFVKDSPFKDSIPDKVVSGMYYDGQKAPTGTASGLPKLTPPCVWFPYGRMGQSASEPRFDTTGGKFGPFAGQLFVGDQTKSMIMRVSLEKIHGRFQGACYPFRSGFQCGINRLVFGPDSSLYAGQTNRGWGSIGPKPYGLQRLVYTGKLPFEIHTTTLTKAGFDLTFTKPLAAAKGPTTKTVSVQSYTYVYHSTYGSPEVDRKAEPVQCVRLSADRRKLSVDLTGIRPGRVYELRLDGVTSADGEPVLHPEAYYTVNELP